MIQRDNFKSFQEFYPYYLSEHSIPTTKLFHFIGTSGFLAIQMMFLGTVVGSMSDPKQAKQINWMLQWYAVFCAYFFAWISHAFIEKNKPATFKYPFWSARGDFKMYFEIIQGYHTIF